MAQKQFKIGLSNADKQAMATNVRKLVVAQLFATYSSSTTYDIGDFCQYDGTIYKCIVAITTAEAWNADHWAVAKINEVIDAINEAVASVDSKANVDGYYPTMSNGHSDSSASLDSNVGNQDETPIAYNSVGVNSDVATGFQRLDKLVGVKLVKNSYVKKSYLSSLNQSGGLTFSVDTTEGSISVSGSVSESLSYGHFPLGKSLTNGHIILIYIKNILPENTRFGIMTDGYYYADNIAMNNTNMQIITVPNEGNYNKAIFWTNTVSIADTFKFFPRIMDLTQRYGNNDVVNAIIGSDTSKQVERLLQFDPNILKDTDYDEGSFTTCQSAYLESTDYNVWNEDFGKDFFIDGQTGVKGSGAYCGTNTKVRVKASSKYAIIFPSSLGSSIFVYQYDINGNYIGSNASDTNTTQAYIFDTLPNCAYIEFCKSQNTYGTTYNNDICLFEYWDGSRIGYEKFERHLYPMPNVDLNGVLTVKDGKVVADGDELYPDNTNNKKRYDVVDLSTLTGWTHWETSRTGVYAWKKDIANMKLAPAYNQKADAIAERFSIMAQSTTDNYAGRAFIAFDEHSIYIFQDQNSTPPAGKLVYAITEPEDLEAENFPANIYGDDFGHFRFLDVNQEEIKGLQGADFFYEANIAGFAESLGVRADWHSGNIVIQEDLEPFSAKDTQLLNAVGGTLRQCLCVKESLDFDNTNVVDLGDLGWVYSNGIFIVNIPADGKPHYDDVSPANVICTKYKTVARNDTESTNKAISWKTEIRVNDSSYTDATAFKNAMKGVLLAYEKASE